MGWEEPAGLAFFAAVIIAGRLMFGTWPWE